MTIDTAGAELLLNSRAHHRLRRSPHPKSGDPRLSTHRLRERLGGESDLE